MCLECNRKQIAEWRRKNKEKTREYSREYYYKNREEFHNKYLLHKERYRHLYRVLVKFMGGKCEVCEYNENVAALDIHHRDFKGNICNKTKHPLRRANMIEKWISGGIPDYLVLLCSNCHRIHHDNLIRNPNYDGLPSTPTEKEI